MSKRTWATLAIALVDLAAVLTRARRRASTAATAPICAASLGDVAPAPPPTREVTYVWHLGLRDGWPVVEAVVGGCPVRALLDTGVTGPIVERWFADRLGLARRDAGALATDLDGRTSPVSIVEPIAIDVPDVGVTTNAQAVLDDDRVPRRYGIAVIAPPQFSVGHEDVTVLDFERKRYEKLAHAAAVERVGRRTPTFEATDDGCGVFHTRAWVEGVAANLLVDTGSPISGVYGASDAGRPLAAAATDWHTSDSTLFGDGAREENVRPNVRLVVGDLAGAMWLATWKGEGHTRDGPCGFDGLLGTDFFIARRCVLAFDQGAWVDGGGGLRFTRLRAYCRP